MKITIPYKTDVPSRNGKIYPKDVVRKAFDQYFKRRNGLPLGGLSNENTSDVNLLSISHKVLGYKETDTGFDVDIEILETPSGRILKDLRTQGQEIGVFIRGVGRVEGNIVKEINVVSVDAGPRNGNFQNLS